MKDFARSAALSSHPQNTLDEGWWAKPLLLTSSLAAVVFIHWLILF